MTCVANGRAKDGCDSFRVGCEKRTLSKLKTENACCRSLAGDVILGKAKDLIQFQYHRAGSTHPVNAFNV